MLKEAAPPFQLPLDWNLVKFPFDTVTLFKSAFLQTTISEEITHPEATALPFIKISVPTGELTCWFNIGLDSIAEVKQPGRSGIKLQVITSPFCSEVLV